MFTGLVEGKVSVIAMQNQGAGCRLTVELSHLANGAQIGDSISLAGCCLTVVKLNGSQADFELGSETLSRTGFSNVRAGSELNCERSLRVGDRMGGHFVTGHIDGRGKLHSIREEGPWKFLHFEAAPELLSQIASKGSITIDGVSLTVVDATNTSFSVALIPHTLDVTTLGQLQVGDGVNLETDVLAKYVARLQESLA